MIAIKREVHGYYFIFQGIMIMIVNLFSNKEISQFIKLFIKYLILKIALNVLKYYLKKIKIYHQIGFLKAKKCDRTW